MCNFYIKLFTILLTLRIRLWRSTQRNKLYSIFFKFTIICLDKILYRCHFKQLFFIRT